MEAATQKKKTVGLKGKLKKTIKNVLSRPDPVLWPVLTEENENILSMALNKYKVDIPAFTNQHWKELKQIPKEERPKPPKLPKQEGLIFGIAECCEAVKSKDCSAMVVESEVNPRLLVQSVIEACTSANIPIVCLKHLRKLSLANFGIKTTCLGVRKHHLEELTNRITELSKSCKSIQGKETFKEIENETELKTRIPVKTDNNIEVTNLLLLRKNKKIRVFVPPSENASKEVKQFVGQDFIEFPSKTTKLGKDNGLFKKMMLKRVANNPNRVKTGKKRKTENTKL